MPKIIEGKRKWSMGLAGIAGIIKIATMVGAGAIGGPVAMVAIAGISAVTVGLIAVQGGVDKAEKPPAIGETKYAKLIEKVRAFEGDSD